jgi:hypothetical protein
MPRLGRCIEFVSPAGYSFAFCLRLIRFLEMGVYMHMQGES